MKIAEIDWQVFWNALSQQDCAGRDRWLGRWVFADDGVRLSMAPALSQSGCSNITGDGEVPDHDVFAVRTLPNATKPAGRLARGLKVIKRVSRRITFVSAPTPSRIDMSG